MHHHNAVIQKEKQEHYTIKTDFNIIWKPTVHLFLEMHIKTSKDKQKSDLLVTFIIKIIPRPNKIYLKHASVRYECIRKSGWIVCFIGMAHRK